MTHAGKRSLRDLSPKRLASEIRTLGTTSSIPYFQGIHLSIFDFDNCKPRRNTVVAFHCQCRIPHVEMITSTGNLCNRKILEFEKAVLAAFIVMEDHSASTSEDIPRNTNLDFYALMQSQGGTYIASSFAGSHFHEMAGAESSIRYPTGWCLWLEWCDIKPLLYNCHHLILTIIRFLFVAII